MKKIILLVSFFFIADCMGMRRGGKTPIQEGGGKAEELRRSKRKRNMQYYGDVEESEEVLDEEESQEKEERRKKRVAHNNKTYFVMSPDGKEILKGNTKQNLQRSYLRKLVIHLGYDSEAQIKKIEQHYKNQDVQAVRAQADKEEIKLKKYFMSCPGCNQIIHNEKRERVFFHAVFIHWYLTQIHQTKLGPYVAKMFATTEEDARRNYNRFKNNTPKVFPFPGDDPPSPLRLRKNYGESNQLRRDNYARAPKGASASDQNEDQEKSEEESVDESTDGAMQDLEDESGEGVIQHLENEELVNPEMPTYYLVEQVPNHLNAFSTFVGNFPQEVIASYAMAKTPRLINQFSWSADELEKDEVIQKQLLIQQGNGCKRLVCPSQGCWQLVHTDDVDEQEEVSKKKLLFDLVAHRLDAHQEESLLYGQLKKLVGHSFEDAKLKALALAPVMHESDN